MTKRIASAYSEYFIFLLKHLCFDSVQSLRSNEKLYKQFILLLIMDWFKKKKKVLDLTRYKKKFPKEESQENDVKDLTSNSESQNIPANSANSGSSGGFFGNFFGFGSSSAPAENMPQTVSEPSTPDLEERRQKLVKRLTYMTDKLEELSNQIYKLQQRIELIERKVSIDKEF